MSHNANDGATENKAPKVLRIKEMRKGKTSLELRLRIAEMTLSVTYSKLIVRGRVELPFKKSDSKKPGCIVVTETPLGLNSRDKHFANSPMASLVFE